MEQLTKAKEIIIEFMKYETNEYDGSCIAKQEALFESFVCEHNEQFEPLDTGEVEKCQL